MQLVEQGKIKLDAKLSDYLTYYRKDNGDKITIHNLLTHTSEFRITQIQNSWKTI
jgi:CubicO group peptidase (beta-lactamase class C family)